MNQSINTDSKNSKEPQQKYRLRMTVDLDLDQTAENDSADLDQNAVNRKWCRAWSDWEWKIA